MSTLGMTESYNSNSVLQKTAAQLSSKLIEDAIDALDVTSIGLIADFGVSHGANSIRAMKTILESLRKRNKLTESEQPLIVHNDLPTNDWTTFCQLLNEENCYRGVISGRSFYEQCLPNNSLSIGYSSISLHWLSAKPCDVDNAFHVNAIANPAAHRAFQEQSYLDYRHFLQHRSAELATGGVLILIIPYSNEQGQIGFEPILELLFTCAQLLPLTSEELLAYTNPVYCRTYDECVDENLFAQYSFRLIKSKTVSIPSPIFQQWKEKRIPFEEYVRLTTSFVRAFSESILEQTLRKHRDTQTDLPDLLTRFWTLYEEQIRERPESGHFTGEYAYVILKKT